MLAFDDRREVAYALASCKHAAADRNGDIDQANYPTRKLGGTMSEEKGTHGAGKYRVQNRRGC